MDVPVFVDLLVALDVSDRRAGHITPAAYMTTARHLRSLIWRNFRRSPMRAFTGSSDTLLCIAENIFFENHGRLPDVAGASAARQAQATADRAIRKASRRS